LEKKDKPMKKTLVFVFAFLATGMWYADVQALESGHTCDSGEEENLKPVVLEDLIPAS